MKNDMDLLEKSDLKFEEFIQLIEGYIFFNSPEIIEQIKQSEEDLKTGRYKKFNANELKNMLDWLNGKES